MNLEKQIIIEKVENKDINYEADNEAEVDNEIYNTLENTDKKCNKNTQTKEIQKYFISNQNTDLDEEIVDIDYCNIELDNISLPDEEPDDLLFTTIDEITLLRQDIANLKKIIQDKDITIANLNEKYIELENNKDSEIIRLNNKIDEYISEFDDLYLDNLRLKRKYKSKICEIFVPQTYNNFNNVFDYSTS